MSDRDEERDLSEFFRRVPAPEPTLRLRHAVRAARTEVRSANRFVSSGSRLGLSLACLAISIVLSAGLLTVRFGLGRSEAGPGDNASMSPSTSAGELATRDPAFTFGPPGSFKAAGTTAVNPTMSALLPDGRVLLVGGDSTGNASELYDPATGKFTATGPAADYHSRGTLTRLADGRVLLAGGFGVRDQLASAEIYDPATGKFTATGALAAPRFDFSAVPLRTGEVLVVGGSKWIDANGTTTYLQSAELYDPATGTFRSAGEMTVVRNKPAVVTLSDGRVLIAGGRSGWNGQKAPSLSSAEIYDPTTGQFTATGSMTANRALGVPTLLQDGRVLIIGGDDNQMGVQYADLYDPSTGKFSQTGPEAIDRIGHTATLLADGRVLIAGGFRSDGVASVDPAILAMTESRYLSAAELYDPIKGTFTRIGNMTTTRVDATATLLGDGRVLIAGGDLTEPRNRAELYVP